MRPFYDLTSSFFLLQQTTGKSIVIDVWRFMIVSGFCALIAAR